MDKIKKKIKRSFTVGTFFCTYVIKSNEMKV